jgi:hypothetical protein
MSVFSYSVNAEQKAILGSGVAEPPAGVEELHAASIRNTAANGSKRRVISGRSFP